SGVSTWILKEKPPRGTWDSAHPFILEDSGKIPATATPGLRTTVRSISSQPKAISEKPLSDAITERISKLGTPSPSARRQSVPRTLPENSREATHPAKLPGPVRRKRLITGTFMALMSFWFKRSEEHTSELQ